MEKQKNIPVLRFSEFEGDWEKLTISNVCKIIGGGTPESGIEVYWNGNIQWFTPTEIKMDYVSKSIRTITELGLKKSSAKLLPSGTILLTTRATIGEVAIALEECTTNQGFQSLIVNGGFNNVFIFNWIKTNKHEFVERANGSTFLEISKSEIEKIFISTPTLPEQQKIASFFTAIDQKLTQLKKKKDLLEQYKKGVMQKIFSQEIRFRDENGKEFPKWETKTLGDITVFKNGKAHEQDISENGKYIVVNSKFISTEGDVKKYTDKQICPLFYGEIVMVMSDIPNGKALAKCFFIDNDGKYSLNQRICALKSIVVESKFLIYVLNRNPYYLMFDSGVGQTNLKKDEVLDCPLLIPKSITEQTKIANFLSAIDYKINHTQKQIEKAELWKKGLLQKMFV